MGVWFPTNISPLAHLTVLYLTSNKVRDLSPLANLTQLTRLYLVDNQVSDLGPLVANNGLDKGDQVKLRSNLP